MIARRPRSEHFQWFMIGYLSNRDALRSSAAVRASAEARTEPRMSMARVDLENGQNPGIGCLRI